MKSRNKIFLIIFLVLVLLVFLGYSNSQKGMNKVTGNVVKDLGTGDPGDEGKDSGKKEVPLNGSSGPEVQSYTPPASGDGDDGWEEPDEPYTPTFEGPVSCEDTGCADGELCYEKKCVEVECLKDEDCADGDGCTLEKCMFAGHPKAYCPTERITIKEHNDGCCPVGAWVDTDSDCEPVCGNRKCELGEHTADCPIDCKNAGGGSSEEDSGDSCDEC